MSLWYPKCKQSQQANKRGHVWKKQKQANSCKRASCFSLMANSVHPQCKHTATFNTNFSSVVKGKTKPDNLLTNQWGAHVFRVFQRLDIQNTKQQFWIKRSGSVIILHTVLIRGKVVLLLFAQLSSDTLYGFTTTKQKVMWSVEPPWWTLVSVCPLFFRPSITSSPSFTSYPSPLLLRTHYFQKNILEV